MSTNLITHWSEHDEALASMLRRLSSSLAIFDEDLARLRLERPETIEILRHFLAGCGRNGVQIVVKNSEPFRNQSPRLFNLLATYPERLSVVQCPEHLRALDDSLVIVDHMHALIRFHRDHARSRIIFDDTTACAPYVQRFNDIFNEGGEPISATTLGL